MLEWTARPLCRLQQKWAPHCTSPALSRWYQTQSSFVGRVIAGHGAIPIRDQFKKDLSALESAGLLLTEGDVRCLVAGHVARIAINQLRETWDATWPLHRRMSTANAALTQISIEVDVESLAESHRLEKLEARRDVGMPGERPFELAAAELEQRLEEMVDATFSDLVSEFLLMPMGNAFIKYSDFRDAYEVLKIHTKAFEIFSASTARQA